MSLVQFRFLYRLLTGQVDSEEHYRGSTSLISRACRKNGWVDDGGDFPGGCAVSAAGQAAMRAAFPEFFDDHTPA